MFLSVISRFGLQSAWALASLLANCFPASLTGCASMEFGGGSQINIPIAVLIWLMIYPMMLKVDFASVLDVGRRA